MTLREEFVENASSELKCTNLVQYNKVKIFWYHFTRKIYILLIENLQLMK